MSDLILFGDCRESLRFFAENGFRARTCVTSPPYFGLRDYGHDGQLGLEPTPAEYVAAMVDVFRGVWDVLTADGTLWLNIGDSYYSGNGQPKGNDPKSPSRNVSRDFYRWADRPGMGLPKKSLVGIPWMVAHALQAAGWTLRSEIIWFRNTSFIEAGVSDRVFRKHETIFMLSKSRRYYFNKHMRALGSVWDFPHERNAKGHNAAFPKELPKRCIFAGSAPGDTVLDPFMGSGTTAQVAKQHGRFYLGCELNPEYESLQLERLAKLSAC